MNCLPLRLLPLVALVGCLSPGPSAGRGQPDWREIEGEPLIEVLPRDAIPSIDAPTYVSADEADAFMRADEPVLGVVGAEGTARAYSAWHLDHHEIVNDVLDGEPIAATW